MHSQLYVKWESLREMEIMKDKKTRGFFLNAWWDYKGIKELRRALSMGTEWKNGI